VIPSSNFSDGLKSSVKDLHQSTRKVYYDIGGKPYLTCSKCNSHVAIEKNKISQPQHQPPPQPLQQGQSSIPPSVEGGAPGGAIASSPASSAPEGQYQGENIVCPNCKNPIEGGGAAGAGAQVN
jgi:hypothetical protein